MEGDDMHTYLIGLVGKVFVVIQEYSGYNSLAVGIDKLQLIKNEEWSTPT